MTFLTSWIETGILCSFRLVLEVIPDSSRLEFLQTLSTNKFALFDAEGNRGGITGSPLLRTLLTIAKSFNSQVSGSDKLFFFC